MEAVDISNDGECVRTLLVHNAVNDEQAGGLMKMILRQGTGAASPSKGAKVEVHYVGTLLDGSKFDSSRDRGEPFRFDLGKGRVIKGWDLGVATMKRGEVAVLTCKPDYAYGDKPAGDKVTKHKISYFRFVCATFLVRMSNVNDIRFQRIRRCSLKSSCCRGTISLI
jgi:FK506-binding protein 4/5